VNGGAGGRENLRLPDIRAQLDADEDDDAEDDEGGGDFYKFRRSFQRRLQEECTANFSGTPWLRNTLKADAGGGGSWRLPVARVNATCKLLNLDPIHEAYSRQPRPRQPRPRQPRPRQPRPRQPRPRQPRPRCPRYACGGQPSRSLFIRSRRWPCQLLAGGGGEEGKEEGK